MSADLHEELSEADEGKNIKNGGVKTPNISNK